VGWQVILGLTLCFIVIFRHQKTPVKKAQNPFFRCKFVIFSRFFAGFLTRKASNVRARTVSAVLV
jgi:hypothetical protein